MLVYYNEWEKYPAEWLRNLILTGELPEGIVDETDIRKINPDDIAKYETCHFFSGIGGWPYALSLAGWPEGRGVWTGSCPCQPFSVAGAQKAQADDRHLWPSFFRLIRECRPATVFMEQVRGAITHGWLDEVSRNLEDEGYAVGAAVLPACGVGAPHRRERLWIVADARGAGWRARGLCNNNNDEQPLGEGRSAIITQPSETLVSLAHANNVHAQRIESRCDDSIVGQEPGERSARLRDGTGVDGFWASEPDVGRVAHGFSPRMGHNCANQKADETPSRVEMLRAFGNAIVPQVAAQFIKAFLEAEKDL